MTRLAAFLCALAAMVLCPLRVPAAPQSLWISYFDCPKNLYGYSVPRAVVSNMRGAMITQRSWRQVHAVAQRDLELRLAPGFYQLFVGNGNCGDDLMVTLLPGHSRHVIALGTSMAYLDRRNTMVSGTLPSRGWQVAIVYRDRPQDYSLRSSSRDGYLQYPAQVEGDAYYAVGLPDGKFTVRLYNGWQATWLDIDGGQIDYAKGPRAVIRNITERDVSAKLRDLARKSWTCIVLSSGVKVCTPPT